MKYRLYLKSFNKDLINKTITQIRILLLKENLTVSGIVSLPNKIKKFCVLRSPQIDKDSREHFELRIYKKFIDIHANTPNLFDKLLNMDIAPGVISSFVLLKD